MAPARRASRARRSKSGQIPRTRPAASGYPLGDMKKLVLLVALVGVFLAGCQQDDKAGQPVKQGDYTTEPGGAAKPKTGE